MIIDCQKSYPSVPTLYSQLRNNIGLWLHGWSTNGSWLSNWLINWFINWFVHRALLVKFYCWLKDSLRLNYYRPTRRVLQAWNAPRDFYENWPGSLLSVEYRVFDLDLGQFNEPSELQERSSSCLLYDDIRPPPEGCRPPCEWWIWPSYKLSRNCIGQTIILISSIVCHLSPYMKVHACHFLYKVI